MKKIVALALIALILTGCNEVNGESQYECESNLVEDHDKIYEGSKEIKTSRFSGEFTSNVELSIREGPGLNYNIIGTTDPHGKVIATSKADHEGILWYYIKYGDIYGWSSSEYLTPHKEKKAVDNSGESSQPKPEGNSYVEKHNETYYALANINVYSGAGTEYEILGSLSQNESIDTTGKLDGWHEFNYNGSKGYVSGDNLAQIEIENEQADVSIKRTSSKVKVEASADTKNNLTIPSNHNITSTEAKVIELVNNERKKAGLSKLSTDNNLNYLSRLKASDVGKHEYRSHTSPTYGTPFEMMSNHGVNYKSAAENLSGYYLSPAHAVEGWMNSPGHKDNILDKRWTHIGAGYSIQGEVWVTLFIEKQ